MNRPKTKCYQAFIIFILFIWNIKSTFAEAGTEKEKKNLSVTKYTPVQIQVPSGGNYDDMVVIIPNTESDSMEITNPMQLRSHVQEAWKVIVEENQEGLLDPKQQHLSSPDLSAEEAWHHHQAAKNGIVDSGRFLITFSLIPSIQAGGNALFIQAAMNNLKAVEYLIDEQDYDINVEKVDGSQPLHAAITMGNYEVTKVLLERGANREALFVGATPLMIASALGHTEIVRLLVMPLESSSSSSNTNAQRSEVDLNRQHSFAGTTALHFAAEMGRNETIRELCLLGADPTIRTITGGTPLHTASDANQTEAVIALVNYCNANINELLMGDTTPLYLAAQRGFTNVVKTLLQLGADPNHVMKPQTQFSKHIVSLDSAKQYGQGYPEYYDPKNTELGNGATCLHAASENGHLDVVRVLLKAGALQTASMEGATPLIIALQYQQPLIALALLGETQGDKFINARVPKDKESALTIASRYGYAQVVQKILKKNSIDKTSDTVTKNDNDNKKTKGNLVHVDISNGNGKTPLALAIQSAIYAPESVKRRPAKKTLSIKKKNSDNNDNNIDNASESSNTSTRIRPVFKKIVRLLLKYGADPTVEFSPGIPIRDKCVRYLNSIMNRFTPETVDKKTRIVMKELYEISKLLDNAITTT